MMKKAVVITGIGVGIGVSVAIVRYFYVQRKALETESCNASVELRLELPRKFLGYIIGKRGATIKKIREETCTSIRLRDQDSEVASVVIRGSPHNVKAASEEIKRLTSQQQSNFTKDVHVPANAWISVVGLNGEVVRQISYESKAKLTVNFSPHEGSSECHISVHGTREQLDHALSLIDERIAEGEVGQQQSKTVGIAGRSLLENVLPSMHNSLRQETLHTDSADGFTQVFVSAMQSPSLFWVQLCGPKSVQLDKLIGEMTDFYSDPTRQSSLVMPTVLPGDFVAAYFDGDKDWYRGLVLSVEKLSSKVGATVLFVDFGDSASVELGMLCKLKPEFAVLPMQAIKCSLSGISPVGERWSGDAVKMFEDLIYVAQWKVLMAKPDDTENHDSKERSEINSVKSDCIPVRLIDTNGNADVDIGEELVKAGHARSLTNVSQQPKLDD